MKRTTILMAAFLCLFSLTESPAQNTHKNMEQLNLTQEWDKTYPKSDKVNHSKVTFINRYGITLAADLYAPKTIFGGKLPAIAVSGPFGAVKEQSSGLYAQTLAERGFLTIAFDPSFTGESGGQPRSVASPDINTEDFCAAVDFLSVQENVDPERIGIIGICGWRDTSGCGCRTNRHHWHLWLGWFCYQCGCQRHTYQGNGSFHNVRH